MQHHAYKRSRKVLGWLAIIGLSVLMLILWLLRRKPQAIIRRTLTKYSLSPLTVNYWIAVSAFETAGWTSQVYKDSNNLFNLIVPGSNKLPYGEHQTIFASPEESAVALYTKVIAPLKYALQYPSLRSLTDQMASKEFYTSDPNIYYTDTLSWLRKLNLGTS